MSTALAAWPQQRWQPQPQTPAQVWSPAPQQDRELSIGDELLRQLGELASGDLRHAKLRTRAIEWYLPMTVYLASRFRGRSEPLTDLTQVAVIGLIKALDRFDPGQGVPFAGYAIPSIVGELKHHFRDTTWNVRVPRRLQELKLQLTTVTEDLAHTLNRTPTTAELAARLGVSTADVHAVRRCETAYRPVSLQQPSSDGSDRYLIDSLGATDPEIDMIDLRETLRRRLAELPPRERRIITLRFYAEMSQAQIAADIGVSQMQVSRLLARSLTRLRDALSGTGAGLAGSGRS